MKLNIQDKIPPRAIELEKSVIGQILINSDSFVNVSDILTSEMFYKKENQTFYEALQLMFNNKEQIDTLTFVNHLRNTGKIEEVGGVMAVMQLTNNILSSTNIRSHAKIILEKYLQRKLIAFNYLQVERLNNEFKLVSEIELISKEITNISQKYVGINTKSLSFMDLLLLNIESYYTKKNTEVKNEYEFGISELNKNLMIERGDLILLAGRPAMGKTAFALQLIRDFSRTGKKGLVISLEMTKEKLISRIVIAEAKIDNKRYRMGQLQSYEETRLNEVTRKIDNWNLSITDKSSLTISEIETLVIMENPEYVVLDYLGLVYLEGKDTRNNELGAVAKRLKAVAKRVNIPIIALHQLSRDVEKRGDKRPILSDLRDSGELEQDADVIMFLYRDAYYTKDSNNMEIEIDIAKYREGASGFIKIEHDYQVSNFFNRGVF